MSLGCRNVALDKLDLEGLTAPLTIISSNRQKADDMALVLGSDNVSWHRYEPKEYQASKEHDKLRLLGRQYYAKIARESAMEKFDLIRRDLPQLQPGYTIVDSSLWQPSFDGLPGLNAAQMYATCEIIETSKGKQGGQGAAERRSDKMLRVACQSAIDDQDRRIYWIETAVTVKRSCDGQLEPVVRQQIGICFTPREPWPSGGGMWPITCPNPIKLAELRADKLAVRHLSKIGRTERGVKSKLAEEAEKIGLLVPYAALQREEVVPLCPRGWLAMKLAQGLSR
jgi:hypothetical protein